MMYTSLKALPYIYLRSPLVGTPNYGGSDTDHKDADVVITYSVTVSISVTLTFVAAIFVKWKLKKIRK